MRTKLLKICLATLLIASLVIFVTTYSPMTRAVSGSPRHSVIHNGSLPTSLLPSSLPDKLSNRTRKEKITITSNNNNNNNNNTRVGVKADSNNEGKEKANQEQRTKLLCMNFSGRLGNQLFQYASAFGLAKKLNRIPVFEAGSELNSALQNPPPLAPISSEHRQRCRTARRQGESKAHCCKFHPEFVNLDPNYDYTIGQYLQSWRYFEGYEDEVREAMRFKDAVRAEADKKLTELRHQYANRTLVGIHVRRGDYLRSLHLRMGYRTAPPEYFTRAMDFMRQRFGNVTFFVSADDAGKAWFVKSVRASASASSSSSSSDAKNQTAGGSGSGSGAPPSALSPPSSSASSSTSAQSDVVMLKRGSVAGDMALLAAMDHVIISVGTYSWWAGFLNRGVTVYWKDFVAPSTEIGNQFLPNGEGHVLPSWVPF